MTDAMLLGIDVGTTAVKAQLVDAQGESQGAASVPTPWTRSADGRVEAPVHAVVAAVGLVVAALDVDRVAAIGIAGMAESGAGYGRDGRPLTPVIAWNDTRGDEAVARLEDVFGTEYSRWIGQRARTFLSVAKLAWLVDHGVAVHRWLGVPELVLQALTGVDATEHSLAARTGCYDVGTRRWRPEVADVLGLPPGAFPEVCTAGSVMGRVSSGGGAWSGLRGGTPVTIAGHDHLAGTIGAGAGEGDLVNSVGTAETVLGRFAAVPDLDVALENRLAVTVVPGASGWAALAGAARAGLVIRAAAAALGRTPEQLDHDAAAPAGVVLPDVADWAAALADGRSTEVPEGPPGAVWAGVLGALSARTADAAGRVMQLGGHWERMLVIGGGARSEPWLRAKAAASPVPVWRTATEAAARGAALWAGAAAGWWPSAESAPAPSAAPVSPAPP